MSGVRGERDLSQKKLSKLIKVQKNTLRQKQLQK